MSNKLLVLRLSGVMQSWGYDSQYTYRNTGLFPTKSAVLGLCCAAKGLKRGSQEERQFLLSVSRCPMTAIALPRKRSIENKTWSINVRRIDDFHTVQGTLNAKGEQQIVKINGKQQTYSNGKKVLQCDVTYRQYLCDADFIVLLDVEENIAIELKDKLTNPKWGIWLGKKSCIPSIPVFSGMFNNIDEICNALLDGKTLKHFTYQKEVEYFEEGTDSFLDIPNGYAIDKRERGQRRVKTYEAEK
jgi:CRISPR system Cascade subunit CasD